MNELMKSSPGTYFYGQSKPKLSSLDKPKTMDMWSIGFESMWNMLESLNRSQSSSTYPPYNIIHNGNDYSVEIAVAGFSREDLTITVEDNLLLIEGVKPSSEAEYVHKGIGARNFRHKFLLGEHVEIKDARLENGILIIDLFRNVPEDKKPRVIEIA